MSRYEGRPRAAGPAARRRRRDLPVWDWRVLARRIHLLSGALAGLFLVIAGLTGSALVFRNELDVLLHPALLRVDPVRDRVPLDEVVAAVEREYPGEAVLRIRLPKSPEETYEAVLEGEDPLEVYVHPGVGTVLGARRASETLPNVLFELHTTLLAGPTGETLMGVAALLLLVVVATGAVVWWPGIRSGVHRFLDACIVRRSPNWRRITFDLHRGMGIWSTAFLVVVAVTGASLVFHDAFLNTLNWLTASPPRPVPAVVHAAGGAPSLPLDTLVRRADAVIPDGVATYVTLPTEEGSTVTIRKKVPAELHPNGRNFIYVDPSTGEIRAVEDALRAPAGTRVYNLLYPIHIGRWGGPWSRILYAVLGFTPVALFLSGCIMWWNRSGRRRWRALRPASAADGQGNETFGRREARPEKGAGRRVSV